MYDYLAAVIIGLVEGITEFLPISSTGHIILAQKLLGVSGPVWASFGIMIQLGAILAVVVYFFEKIWGTFVGLFSDPRARYFALLLIVAVLPAIVLGALFNGVIKFYLFNTTSIAITWIIGGLIILWVESTHRQDIHHEADDLPLTTGGLIGLAQAVSMIPGTSRSAATIVGARLLGVDRRAAAEFSFFLAIPTMVAAFAYEAFKNRHEFTTSSMGLIGVGFVVSFVSAYAVIRPFLEFVSTRGFAPFAYYRILLGGAVLAFTIAVGM